MIINHKGGNIMNKLKNIKLFNDLNKISLKYSSLPNLVEKNDINDNNKLQQLLLSYKNNINDIKIRSNLISKQARDMAKDSNARQIFDTIIDLNNFAMDRYNNIMNSNENMESSPVQALLNTTVEELILINNSIKYKEFLRDKFSYFYIYEKIAINAFINFLVLKDMNIDKDKIESLSQAILSQIQCLSLISM